MPTPTRAWHEAAGASKQLVLASRGKGRRSSWWAPKTLVVTAAIVRADATLLRHDLRAGPLHRSSARQPTHSFAYFRCRRDPGESEQLVNTEGLKPGRRVSWRAVSTGYGAARNLGQVRRDVVAVFGVGASASCHPGARVRRARVVAVESMPRRNPQPEVRHQCFVLLPAARRKRNCRHVTAAHRAPVDVVNCASGVPANVDASILNPNEAHLRAGGSTRAQTGRASRVQLPPWGARSFRSSTRTNPRRDFAALIDLAAQGRDRIDSHITRVWPRPISKRAGRPCATGDVVRAVLTHG